MSKTATATTIKIQECVCPHEFQDQRYGKGKRVMNPMKSGHRCTVCGRAHIKG
jgi:hypothetical protein